MAGIEDCYTASRGNTKTQVGAGTASKDMRACMYSMSAWDRFVAAPLISAFDSNALLAHQQIALFTFCSPSAPNHWARYHRATLCAPRSTPWR